MTDPSKTSLIATLILVATLMGMSPCFPANPVALLSEGGASYQRGDFEAAQHDWLTAADTFRAENDARGQGESLVKAAAASQGMGDFQLAVLQLEEARRLAEQAGDKRRLADILNQLGSARLLLRDTTAAEPLLTEALRLAWDLQITALEASVLDNLGSLRQLQGDDNAALELYARCLGLADKADNTALVARTATNAGELALETEAYQTADTYLTRARSSANLMSDSHNKVYLLIRIARLQYRLADTSPVRKAELVLSSYSGLRDAAAIAERLIDPRAESWAWGYLGTLYENQGRTDEAQNLTRRAIFALQGVNAPEVLYRWEWQKARLLKAEGNSREALKVYRSAIDQLVSVRSELANSLEDTHVSYHRLVGPLFLEYADLLLKEGEAINDPGAIQHTLLEARNTVELLKSVELQDYFQDDCVSLTLARVKGLEETLSAHTAVIYPILFQDRTDLLLSTRDGLSRHSVPISAQQITTEAHDFRHMLEKLTTRQYLRPAQRLYDWLIRPLETDLAAHDIDTLVIVPDAALRIIPMAALHDGKEFLVQKYALASTPSLELTDPRPLRTENMDLLLNGLTEPVQGFPGLPNVSEELQAIQAMYGGRILENSAFTIGAFREQLAEHPFSIVHIASHGKFEGKVKDSFILTYDGKLTMDDLERYVGLSRVRADHPVELLTLSACQTAVGDDWAGLGLASVAIKAGARSALATLWYVNDQVTSALVSGFYRQLGKPGMTKAKALQQAQLAILEDMRYGHPAYWAPYLLIGNWL